MRCKPSLYLEPLIQEAMLAPYPGPSVTEDGVNGLYGVQKLECNGVSAWLHDDCKRPKVSLCKFPQGPSGAEVLGFDESLVTDFAIWCWSSSSVYESLVLQLCSSHLLMEKLVEGVKINRVFTSSFGGKVSFWMDRDVGVVALVGKEGRDVSGCIWSIIV